MCRMTIFRPSIVLGDSRYPETTQFDMVKAFVFLAGLPVLPFRPNDKIDIVNVDFVADAIVDASSKARAALRHLSSFFGEWFADVPGSDRRAGGSAREARAGVHAILERPFSGSVEHAGESQGRCWDTARRS